MLDFFNKLPISQMLLLVVIGILLYITFYIVNNYIIPILRNNNLEINKYWQQIQILSWLLFLGLFYIALFRSNMYITIAFSIVILGLGWNYWMNIFSGIIIKFDNQFKVGESISTDFAAGKLRAIHLSQSELINANGELVIIPNFKLRSSVLKRVYDKDNVQTHTFSLKNLENETLETLYQKALNCPFISANQKVDIELKNENEFLIKVSVIDRTYVDKVYQYFS